VTNQEEKERAQCIHMLVHIIRHSLAPHAMSKRKQTASYMKLKIQPDRPETARSWPNGAERLSWQSNWLRTTSTLHTRHVSIFKKIFFPCGIDCYQVV